MVVLVRWRLHELISRKIHILKNGCKTLEKKISVEYKWLNREMKNAVRKMSKKMRKSFF